jgi:hypothetical protein
MNLPSISYHFSSWNQIIVPYCSFTLENMFSRPLVSSDLVTSSVFRSPWLPRRSHAYWTPINLSESVQIESCSFSICTGWLIFHSNKYYYRMCQSRVRMELSRLLAKLRWHSSLTGLYGMRLNSCSASTCLCLQCYSEDPSTESQWRSCANSQPNIAYQMYSS